MIDDLFDHTCDIYHAIGTEESPGYGLPASTDFKYPEKPDVVAVPCHFSIRQISASMIQNEPQTDLDARDKVGFPIGTDIRLNDKVVHLETGLAYRAEIPRNIRDHHINIFVQRYGKWAPI